MSYELEIWAIYARIPKVNCKRKCFQSCGPILASPAEEARIESHLGHPPSFTTDEKLRCSFLSNDNLCTIYEVRPAICRLWGVIPKMHCPFGCKPERWLSDDEARRILSDLENLRSRFDLTSRPKDSDNSAQDGS